MSEEILKIIKPEDCSETEIQAFYDLVKSGNQVALINLEVKIRRAKVLAFAYIDDQLAGVASLKNQKQSYITKTFLKAKVPFKAKAYKTEMGYAVTAPDYRRMGISTKLIIELFKSTEETSFYATTKNDGMRDLLEGLKFEKLGSSFLNDNEEILNLYVFNK